MSESGFYGILIIHLFYKRNKNTNCHEGVELVLSYGEICLPRTKSIVRGKKIFELYSFELWRLHCISNYIKKLTGLSLMFDEDSLFKKVSTGTSPELLTSNFLHNFSYSTGEILNVFVDNACWKTIFNTSPFSVKLNFSRKASTLKWNENEN